MCAFIEHKENQVIVGELLGVLYGPFKAFSEDACCGKEEEQT